ncbi:SPOCS domain-containing protein [Clostridium sp.]|uniref:DUF3794 and LysM peptidoglycan-binding domain-containing protein n=1 Tax=Clostridium sp. TaxID=1506 RepID=UPI002FC7E8FB
MRLDLIKDNIEYEQLLGQNATDMVVKEEYVIPDTLPDVNEILMLDAKPMVTSKDVANGKVNVEGQIQYTVLYMAKEDEATEAHPVTYNSKFSSCLDMNGATSDMLCEIDLCMEHINCIIVNERKISIQGVMNVKCDAYKMNSFEIVKEVENGNDLQFLKSPMTIDKVMAPISGEIIGKAEIKIDMDKPEVGKVVKYNVVIGKKDVRLYDGGVRIEAVANVCILYKVKSCRDLVSVSVNVPLMKELTIEGLKSNMDHYTDFEVNSFDCDIREDDMGENRILDVEFLVKTCTHVMYKEEVEMIEDAYCPSNLIDMDTMEYDMNIIQGQGQHESLVKGDIEIGEGMVKPNKVIMAYGSVSITDKNLNEDKVTIEGVLKVDVLYTTEDEEYYVASVSDEIPFTSQIEINGAKDYMDALSKVNLEMLEANVEVGNISIRAIIKTHCKVCYNVKKKFLVDMQASDAEVPGKKASIIIYVVQPGDTLWQIAKKYFTTKEQIMYLNELPENVEIKPTQKLIIPGRAIM